jgi:hypothetical protein
MEGVASLYSASWSVWVRKIRKPPKTDPRHINDTTKGELARETVAGVRAHPGCGHTQVEPPRDSLPLVGCYVGLDFSCVGILLRCISCLGFWHDTPYVRALICLATGPLFFGLS